MTCVERPAMDFRALVARHLGLWFGDHQRELLDGVLRTRLAATGWKQEAYLESLAGPAADAEWRLLVPMLTVTETYFLRGRDHFAAFIETLIPERLRVRPPGRPLRLLSAGAASGEEAYSMALLLREHAARLGLGDCPVEILGIDINREALAKARAARYSAWSLRETPPEIRARYFRAVRSEFVLDESVAAAVTFEERNLAEPQDDLWRRGRFDGVFCRNVLMYFQPETAAKIVARIEQSLAPGGFLFLGHAETLRGLSHAFQLRWDHDTFFYQLSGLNDHAVAHATGAGNRSTASAPGFSAEVEPPGDDTPAWMREIDRASVRIAHLAEAMPKPGETAVGRSTRTSDAAIKRVLDLQRQERFGEALAHLLDLPDTAMAREDRQVLRAMLMVNCGRLAEAEALCGPLAGRDERNAGAHYIAGLCREHAGDLAAAETHGAAAAALDPTFAMARFHLGLICKRTARHADARAHFEAAGVLLLKEDPARLLVFGGGFSRDVLIQACHGEIGRARHHE